LEKNILSQPVDALQERVFQSLESQGIQCQKGGSIAETKGTGQNEQTTGEEVWSP